MKTHTTKALLIAAAMGICGSAAAATGGTGNIDEPGLHSQTVSFDAGEVRSPRDAKRLFFRIRQTAEDLCRLSSHPVGYEIWQEHDCEAAAVAQAVRSAQVPELEDYYERLGGAPDLLRQDR